jgi:hypothetical protein
LSKISAIIGQLTTDPMTTSRITHCVSDPRPQATTACGSQACIEYRSIHRFLHQLLLTAQHCSCLFDASSILRTGGAARQFQLSTKCPGVTSSYLDASG